MRRELLRVQNYSGSKDQYHNIVIFASETIGVAYTDGYMRKEFIFALGDACTRSLKRVEYYIIENRLNIIENTYPWEHIFVYSSIKSSFIYQPIFLKKEYLKLCEAYDVLPYVDITMDQLSNLDYLKHELLKAVYLKAEIVIIKDLADLIKDKEKEDFLLMLEKCKQNGMTFICFDKFKEQDQKYLDRLIVMQDGEIMRVLDRKQDMTIALQELNAQTQDSKKIYSIKNSVLEFRKYKRKYSTLDFKLSEGECVWLQIDTLDEAYPFIEHFLSGQSKSIDYLGHKIDQEFLFIDVDPVENSFFKDFTIEENISFVMKRKEGVSWYTSDFKRNIRYELREYIPQDWFELYSSELSKSELLEVVFAKIMFFNPKVLLLLHPFYHLNYSESDIVLRWVHRLKMQSCAIIMLSPIEPHLQSYDRKFNL